MKWISVEDRLPEHLQTVLIHLDKPIKHGEYIAMSTYSNFNTMEGDLFDINGSVWPNMPEPTHWMPLPKPPADD